ncbi:MAG: hypothetical protein AB7P14_00195 [Blastocatellales bacterium]
MVPTVKEILSQVETLSADEQLALASILIEQARKKSATQSGKRNWLDVMGAAPYPLAEEDAQAWVSRERQEGDSEREKSWERTR